MSFSYKRRLKNRGMFKLVILNATEILHFLHHVLKIDPVQFMLDGVSNTELDEVWEIPKYSFLSFVS